MKMELHPINRISGAPYGPGPFWDDAVIHRAVSLIHERTARLLLIGSKKIRIGSFSVDTFFLPEHDHITFPELPHAYGHLGAVASELVIQETVVRRYGRNHSIFIIAADQECDAIARLKWEIKEERPDYDYRGFWCELCGLPRLMGGRQYRQLAWWSLRHRFLWTLSLEIAQQLRMHVQMDAQAQLG